MNLAAALIIAGAAITGLLGCVHLLYTFHGEKLYPRDVAVRHAMMQGTMVITRRTTVWRASLGFNASHSLGLILFALVYVNLAGWHAGFLAQSTFLQVLGLCALLAWVALARAYWFEIPLRGIALACVFYLAGLAMMVLS
jgi:hypothetical protein